LRQAADLHKKLFENANSDWRANDIAQKVAEEKQREMDLLLNRYRYLPVPALVSVSDSNSPESGSGLFGELGSRSRFVKVERKKFSNRILSGSKTLVTMQIRI
jgi:hypothetical protein